jgi:hypothetical protein
LEPRPSTRDARSSKSDAVKFTNFHVAVTSFAAVAGVAIAAYQTFAPSFMAQQPVAMVASSDPTAERPSADMTVGKTDAAPILATEVDELGQTSAVSAALKDGSDKRYAFTSLFDGRADTYLTIEKPDQDLNVLLSFEGTASHAVTAIEYTPPAGIDPLKLATTLDVMVLPDGQMGAAGRPVLSFTLQQSLESQTFPIPGRSQGRGLWLRVAGPESAEKSVVGDFRILSERVAP